MKTKYRILSVLTVLALVASVGAMIAAAAGVTVVPTVTVSPPSGHVGSVVTLSGRDFTPGAHITSVTFAGVAVTTAPVLPLKLIDAPDVPPGADPDTDKDDFLAISFIVPASIRGSRPIVVSDGVRGATVHFIVEPRVTLILPHTGPRGATRTATVTGFTAGRSIDVFAGGVHIGGGVTTDATGGATVPVTMKAAGLITAKDGAGFPSVHNPHIFTFTPGITLDPTSGPAGVSIDVRGTDYTKMATGAAVTITVGGVEVIPAPAPITAAEAAADAFTRRITIPVGMTPGPKTVNVSVTGEPTITAVFTVTVTPSPPEITLTPSEGPSGTVVTVIGTGFPPYATLSQLAIGVAIVTPIPSVVTGKEGHFSATFVVPGIGVGAHTVTATCGGQTASATFEITPAPPPEAIDPPTITLTPSEGLATTISGVGFTHGLPIMVTWDGVAITTIPPTVIAAIEGRFLAVIVAPTITPGGYIIAASDAMGRSAQTAFTVPNFSGPAGPPGPAGPAGPPGPLVRYIEEGMRAGILVLDPELGPVAGASVSLNEAGGHMVIPLGQTDQNGFIAFTAPEVEAAKWFHVTATQGSVLPSRLLVLQAGTLFLPGDVNGDGAVDIFDLVILGRNFGKKTP